MKRLLLVFLAVLIVSTMSVTTFAAESQLKQNGEVLTAPTPEKILDIAKEEITDMLNVHLGESYFLKTSSDNAESNIYSSSYTLGQPINLKEDGGTNRIYDFPVMRDGKIFAIFTIYDDGGNISMQLEENMMAVQLQALKEQGLLQNATFASNDDVFLF